MPEKKKKSKKKGFGFGTKKKKKVTLDGVVLPGKTSNKKSKGVDFNKGGGSKGTGKSTALTGKKAISAKARARKEAYLKGESALDPEEQARQKKRKEEQRALAAARKKLLAGKKK